MTDADLLRRILGAMRPDIPLDWHDNAWLAAKGLDTLEAIERAALAATPAPLLCLMPDFDGDDCRFWAKTYGQEPCANCAKRYDLAAAYAEETK